MKYRFILFAFILCAAEMASAQNLSVFNLDATNFPTLKAKFYAFDANGQQQSPSASEITVTEDGIPRTVTSIACPPKKDPSPITLGIMVDTYSGIDLAKYGAQKLINLLSIPPSEAGITMMDNGAFIVQDLTQKTGKLTTAIAKLQPAPGVDLETMFYAPNAGGVPFVSGRPNKKAIVLLSDLHCPQYNLNKSQLFADCAAQNISVYVVLLHTNDYNGYFKDITANTGGALFEEIKTSTDLDKVILNISASITNDQPCEITWQSDVSCTGDNRTVSFSWSGQTANASYALAAGAIAGLQFSPSSLYIRSKPVGVQFDTTVTITAMNSAFSVTNITSTNPSYNINPKTISLAKGEPKTLTVSYTPPDSSYTWTRFDIATNLCAQTYYASASYPGHKPTLPTLKLTQPNGGEIYLTSSDTLITWKGIPLTDIVKLEYSLDAGNSWNFITDNATGGKYNWHVPEIVSDRCLVRVEQQFSEWVRQISLDDTSQAMPSGISVDNDGNTFVLSEFWGKATLSGMIIQSKNGTVNLLLAKYYPDGTLAWAKRIGENGNTYSSSLTIDKSGNIYVLGSFAHSTEIDGTQIIGDPYYTNENSFIAKFTNDGKILWAKKLADCQQIAEGFQIAVDDNENVYVTGIFQDNAFFGSIELSTQQYMYTISNFFLAKYDNNGDIVWAKQAYGLESGGSSLCIDHGGNVYVTGTFDSTTDFGGIKLILPSRKWNNIFLAKYHSDGSCEWVEKASIDWSSWLSMNLNGDLYFTGTFRDSADFNGLSIKGSAQGDTDTYFLANYHSDGSLAFVKIAPDFVRYSQEAFDIQNNLLLTGSSLKINSLDGIFFDTTNNKHNFIGGLNSKNYFSWVNTYDVNVTGKIIIDNQGNLYLTGPLKGKSNFDGVILTAPTIGRPDPNWGDVYVWKIPPAPLQSDISDTLFSIVAPTFSFTSNTIDLGQVETGTEKDSVVKATICNSGNMPLHVLGMDITGGDKAEFMIMSGAGDFTLQPGECRDVMFSYLPMLSGKVSATVTLRTANGNYPDTIKILGEGIAPLLAVMGNTIDFGQVKIGTYKDTTIVIAIENIGKTSVNFSPASQLGPDVKQFSLQSGAAGFTLPAGATQSISLRFSPSYIGRTSGRIGFPYNGPSTPAILNVFGQGLGGLVSIDNESGYAGDHKDIPMILGKVPVSSVQSLATNFSARVAYDNSVLQPNSSLIQKGNLFDTVTVSGSLTVSDTLSFIPFTVLLGERTVSPMNIVDFNWLDGTGNPVDYDVDTKSGTFTVSNGCGDSLLRNFMLTGKIAAITSISPNPSNTITHIEIQTTEKGRTELAVMNLLGLQVARVFDGELQSGAHSFDFDTSKLPSGSYFVVLTTPTAQKMERIDVAK